MRTPQEAAAALPDQAVPEDAEIRDANGAAHGGMPPPPPRPPRGEPDLAGGGEEEEEPEEENTGQWSPAPLDPEQVQGQDIIPEEEDARLLELLRAQVGGPPRRLIWHLNTPLSVSKLPVCLCMHPACRPPLLSHRTCSDE